MLVSDLTLISGCTPLGGAVLVAAPVFLVTCHYCSKARNPREVCFYPGGVIRCWRCEQWHLKALDLLTTGKIPDTCQSCNTPTRELADDGAGNVGLYLHPKDGIYQVLCRTCSDHYVQQRVDLYRPTEFGANQKL